MFLIGCFRIPQDLCASCWNWMKKHCWNRYYFQAAIQIVRWKKVWRIHCEEIVPCLLKQLHFYFYFHLSCCFCNSTCNWAHMNQAFTVGCTERVRWVNERKYRTVLCHVFFWTLDGATDPRMNWSEGLRCHLVVSPATCFHDGSCEWHSSSCWKCIHHLHFTARSHRYIYFFVSAKPQIYSRGDLWLCFKSFRGSCCSDLTGFCGDRGRTGGLSSERGGGGEVLFQTNSNHLCVLYFPGESEDDTRILTFAGWKLITSSIWKLCVLEVRSRGVRDTLGVVCLTAPTSLHECVEWVGMMRYLRIGVKHEEPSGRPVRACFQSLLHRCLYIKFRRNI